MLHVLETLQGSCAVWYNLLLSGEGDYDTRHAACPVLSGSKWSTFHCYLYCWVACYIHTAPEVGTCEASRLEFESVDSDSIWKWQASRTCHSTTNHTHCSTKKLQPLHHCNWDLFYVYVARAYTLASTVGAIVQHSPGESAFRTSKFVCNNYYYFI